MKRKNSFFACLTALSMGLVAALPANSVGGLLLSKSVTVNAETTIWDGTSDTSWYDGEETEFHLSTAEEFAGLFDIIAGGTTFENQTIILDNDIYLNDCLDEDKWQNSNDYRKLNYKGSFKGTFNGKGHTIYGLFGVNPLFEKNYGTISNIKIEAARLNTSDAMICNVNYGTIENCICSGTVACAGIAYSNYSGASINNCVNNSVLIGKSSSNWDAGGICAVSSGIISDCKNSGEVCFEDARYHTSSVGGIVGRISKGSSVLKCQNNGIVNTDMNYTGGIAGELTMDGSIVECENSGEISGRIDVGGIVGHSEGNIEKAKNTGNVISEYMAGGIAGFANNIAYCCNYGDVSSLNIKNPLGKYEYLREYSVTGGLVGYYYDSTKDDADVIVVVNDSYNRGDINGKGYVGGIIGRVIGQVTFLNCYSASSIVTTSEGLSIGGIIGCQTNKSNNSIENCYYLSSNAPSSIAYGDIRETYGTPKSASNMKKETFANSLGSKYIAVTDNYPVLFWEALKPKLSIDKTELILREFKETAKINCNTNYNGELTWKSSDDKIATIDENGMVTARKNGTCIITVDAGGSSASCEVTVDYGYYFNESSMTLMPGLSKGLVVYSKNTRKPADVDIQFFSSDSTIASVSKQGVVTANATGNTSVNAYVGEAILVCQVNVREVKGDINGDSKFNVQDLITLQKLFYASDDIDQSAATLADFNNDGKINIIDICLMKSDLISRE